VYIGVYRCASVYPAGSPTLREAASRQGRVDSSPGIKHVASKTATPSPLARLRFFKIPCFLGFPTPLSKYRENYGESHLVVPVYTQVLHLTDGYQKPKLDYDRNCHHRQQLKSKLVLGCRRL